MYQQYTCQQLALEAQGISARAASLSGAQLAASGLDHITMMPRPRLLSDNGSSYVADDLAKWFEGKGMQHVRGAPYHPQTQGKIEHQTLKNRYLPGDLEQILSDLVRDELAANKLNTTGEQGESVEASAR